VTDSLEMMMRMPPHRSTAARGLGALTLAMMLAACGMPAGGASPSPTPAAESAMTVLENTSWTLTDVGGTPARPIGSGAGPTLRLDPAAKRASGNTGCNMYSGDYTVGGQTLRFGALVSTRRACVDDALNRQEAAFLRALADTRGFSITGNTLTLSGDAGVVARLVTAR
jgi:heat shock protein HslJ